MNQIFLLYALIVIVLVGGIIIAHQINSFELQNINNYEDCVAAGYPVMESYPEQCVTSDGRNFTRTLPDFCGILINSSCSG